MITRITETCQVGEGRAIHAAAAIYDETNGHCKLISRRTKCHSRGTPLNIMDNGYEKRTVTCRACLRVVNYV